MIYETTTEQHKNPRRKFGFIPYRLELKNFPEYDNFPYNILFVSYANIDGVDMSGSAVYFPDFSTFHEDEDKQSMTYFNQYNRDWTMVIDYEKKKGLWVGIKYYKDESKGGGCGTEWNMAFAHITMGGVVKGERVQFNKMFA